MKKAVQRQVPAAACIVQSVLTDPYRQVLLSAAVDLSDHGPCRLLCGELRHCSSSGGFCNSPHCKQ